MLFVSIPQIQRGDQYLYACRHKLVAMEITSQSIKNITNANISKLMNINKFINGAIKQRKGRHNIRNFNFLCLPFLCFMIKLIKAG